MEKSQYEDMKNMWRDRNERNRLEALKRKKDALDKAQTIADYLKDNYRVKSVYLFGSLVWGKHFSASSDIDLFICGFPERESYWKALVAVEHMAMPFPVSLILDSTADQSLQEKVKKEGVLL
jgi:predicted nucleotidyltransferase